MFTIKKALLFFIVGTIFLFGFGATEVGAAPPQQDDPVESQWHYEPVGYVTTRFLNVRSGPGTNFSTIGRLYSGESVPLVGRNGAGSWLQVRLGNQKGWVSAHYISAPADIITGLPVTDTYDIPTDPVGYVTSYRLNVRSAPGLNQPIVGYLWRGEQVPLVGRNTDSTWLEVRLGAQGKGWVAAQYINSSVPVWNLPVTHDGGTPPPPLQTGIVNVYQLNVRTGPGLYFPVVGVLRQGQQVTILGRNASSQWLKVGLPGGGQGWVSARYVWCDVPLSTFQTLES